MPRRSYAQFVADWERVLAAVEANGEDLAILQEIRPQLAAALDRLKSALAQQDDLLAQYRVSTRAVQTVVQQGKELSYRLRSGLKMKYDRKDDKLLQFGLQPLRPQTRTGKRKPRKEKPEPAMPTDSGSESQ